MLLIIFVEKFVLGLTGNRTAWNAVSPVHLGSQMTTTQKNYDFLI